MKPRVLAFVTLTVLATLGAVSPASADESTHDWTAIKNVSVELDAAIDEPGRSDFTGDVKLKENATLEFGVDGPTISAVGRSKVKFRSRSASGAALYDSGDGTTTALLSRDGGQSAQILVVIKSKRSPESFEFKVGRGRVQKVAVGVTSVEAGGETWVLAPAWAKDAKGTPVPTHYQVRGDLIVQVVDHSKADYKYPIVADPFLGKAIFKNISRDTYNGDYRYNGDLTIWGKTIYYAAGVGGVVGGVSGQAILRTYGWNEWKVRYSGVTNKATIKHQFDCHALGALAAGQWNLERFRSNNVNWIIDVPFHRCNW